MHACTRVCVCFRKGKWGKNYLNYCVFRPPPPVTEGKLNQAIHTPEPRRELLDKDYQSEHLALQPNNTSYSDSPRGSSFCIVWRCVCLARYPPPRPTIGHTPPGSLTEHSAFPSGSRLTTDRLHLHNSGAGWTSHLKHVNNSVDSLVVT